MTARERTAYPDFKPSITAAELIRFYTITDEESQWSHRHTKGEQSRLTLLVSLKCFQSLGYMPSVANIPFAIIEYIADQCHIVIANEATRQNQLQLPKRSRVRYRHAIHRYLNVNPAIDSPISAAVNCG